MTRQQPLVVRCVIIWWYIHQHYMLYLLIKCCTNMYLSIAVDIHLLSFYFWSTLPQQLRRLSFGQHPHQLHYVNGWLNVSISFINIFKQYDFNVCLNSINPPLNCCFWTFSAQFASNGIEALHFTQPISRLLIINPQHLPFFNRKQHTWIHTHILMNIR